MHFSDFDLLTVSRVPGLRYVLGQSLERDLRPESAVLIFEYDLFLAAVGHGSDDRSEWNDSSGKPVAAQNRIHQRRFAPAETANNHKVETIFGQACLQIANALMLGMLFPGKETGS
jgi:hypothetical protein